LKYYQTPAPAGKMQPKML